MAKKKKSSGPDLTQYAKDYGFQLAFLKSDPELYALFRRAIKEKWDTSGNKFALELQKTKWYKTHGSTYRQNLALKTQDPATYAEKFNAAYGDVKNKAAAMGTDLSYAQLKSITEHYVDFGWSDAQLSDTLSKYIMYGSARGQAASDIQAMQQAAWRNGVRYTAHSLRAYARRMAAGDMTIEDFQKQARAQAAHLAPGYADQLKAGVDLYDIASPYMQSMAQTLEMNPADIDLFDPTIRQALGSRDSQGKATSKTLYEFEQDLRSDKRWLKTQNAQDATMSVAHKVLNDWGLAT